jgi:putative endopeptidase
MRIALLATTVLATAAAGVALAQSSGSGGVAPRPAATAASGPQLGAWGVDLAGMDRSRAPGDDFDLFVSGNWRATTQIPADRAAFGQFQVLQDLSQERTRGILEEAARAPGSQIGDFYASFMDEAAANAKGATPVQPWIAEIKAAKDKPALAAQMAKLQRIGVGGLFSVRVGQDDKAPDQYVAGVNQSGLGLPDRDYYLKADPKLDQVRTAYQAYLAQMLTLAGEPNAAARAAAVVAFEKELATAHWTRIESRDSDKTYNKTARADLVKAAPGFGWDAYLGGLGVGTQPAFVVAQPSAVTGEAKAFGAAPVAVLQDYMILRTLRAYAPFLSQPFDRANFAFNGTVLSGTPEQQARWKRGVTVTGGALGEAIGQIYVQRYFPPEAKAAADQLVRNVIAAMGERIDQLSWMAPETKAKARAKLASFTPKIGYPTRWRDYRALVVKRDDLVGNVARANAFEYDRQLRHLGQPIDRTEWFMTPMTINAYANPTMNEIVFPAAILQPPFFDAKADPAVNYGGIGAVIGHEISHHFDDQGRKYDATGKLTDWWTPADVQRFKVFTDALVRQYDAYEPLPGQHVQGGLTLGENIADLAGLTVAFDAYHKSLGGRTAPVLDGFTGDQRFFLGWAQVWRTKYREPALRSQLLSDPHSPGPQRVAMVRNLDGWYRAFGAKAGQGYYLAPDARVRIW